MPDPKPNAAAGVDAKVGNSAFVLNVAEKVAEGKYGDAAFASGMKLAFTPQTYEAAATLTKSVAPVAKALGFVSRNLPIIGGVVMAVYDAKEVYDHLKVGDYKGAAAATVAGVAEVAATTAFGGLAGAGARTLVVESVAAAGGPRVNDAMLVSVGKGAVKLGSKFINGETAPQQTVAAKETTSVQAKKRQPTPSM